jgi:hypothetical protein
VFLPLPLLAIAWNKTRTPLIDLTFLTVSSILLVSSVNHSVKWLLLGPDYSNRLFVTIGLNLLVAAGIGIHMAIKRRWIAVIVAIILALDWMAVASINSVV